MLKTQRMFKLFSLLSTTASDFTNIYFSFWCGVLQRYSSIYAWIVACLKPYIPVCWDLILLRGSQVFEWENINSVLKRITLCVEYDCATVFRLQLITSCKC